MVAFLELMKPSLEEAVHALAAKNVSRVRIVPVFLAAGGHVREDLPKRVAGLRASYPALPIEVDAPIGEQPAVIEAIAASISQPAGRSSP
jgi:sirohydrochlorin cobaltochelatase